MYYNVRLCTTTYYDGHKIVFPATTRKRSPQYDMLYYDEHFSERSWGVSARQKRVPEHHPKLVTPVLRVVLRRALFGAFVGGGTTQAYEIVPRCTMLYHRVSYNVLGCTTKSDVVPQCVLQRAMLYYMTPSHPRMTHISTTWCGRLEARGCPPVFELNMAYDRPNMAEETL